MSAHVELYRGAGRWITPQEALARYGDESFTFEQDQPGKWRWRFRASNGRILADSGQGYSRRIDCLNGCATLLGGVVNVEDDGRTFVLRGQVIDPDWSPYMDGIPVRDLTRDKP